MPPAAGPLDPCRLETRERALVVMALAQRGAEAAALLAGLAGPSGARCAAAAAELSALPGAARAALLAREAARLFAPLPANLERVHPSWLAAALGDVPPALRRALVTMLPPATRAALTAPEDGGPPARPAPAMLAALTRRAFGALCAMPDGDPPAADARVEELPRLPAPALEERLAALGRERAAAALRGAPRPALAALCARLPREEAAAVVALVGAAAGAGPDHAGLRELGDAL
ncbi:MAG TPA: hypothetical protein VGQ83_41615, partial [Polyangia bacterium]